jgi:hypothetical protein
MGEKTWVKKKKKETKSVHTVTQSRVGKLRKGFALVSEARVEKLRRIFHWARRKWRRGKLLGRLLDVDEP